MSVNQSSGILAIWHDMVPDQVKAVCAKHFDGARLQDDGITGAAAQTGLYQLIFTMGG